MPIPVAPDAPSHVTPTAKNRVLVRDVVYNVLGEPAGWVNPFTGWVPLPDGLPFGESVFVLTAGVTTDPYSGEDAEDWEHPTVVEVSGVGVEPRPSGEPVQDARNAITSGFTLYLPGGVVLQVERTEG